MIKKYFIILCAVLFPTIVNATIFYVDCSDSGSTRAGTFAEPFYTVEEVNDAIDATTIGDSDDIYFKENTTCTLTNANTNSDRLELNAIDGTSGDRVIVGCYWNDGGSPNYECLANSKTRPILKGSRFGQSPAGIPSSNGIITKDNRTTNEITGYITIQELEIIDSAREGISVVGPREYGAGVNHAAECDGAGNPFACCTGPSEGATCAQGVSFIVNQCVVSYTDDIAILISDYRNSEITNNYAHHGPLYFTGNSLIEFQANYSGFYNTLPTSHSNLMDGNTVHDCYECLTVFAEEYGTTISNNTCYDPLDACIYIQSSKNIDVFNNLVYESTSGTGNEWGIWIENEDNVGNHCYIGNINIYNNAVSMRADSNTGGNMVFSCDYCYKDNSHCDAWEDPWTCCTGDGTGTCPDQRGCWDGYVVDVFNNTFVEPVKQNYRFQADFSVGGTADVDITNNISLIITGTGKHTNQTAPANVTWTTNSFNDDVDGVNIPANNVTTDRPLLTKTTGWGSITAGSLTWNDFKLQATSPVIDEGTDLGGSPINVDFEDDNRDTNTPWDLGVDEYTAGASSTNSMEGIGLSGVSIN